MEDFATWAAPVATTIAALMTASNLGRRVTGWGFAVFLVGSILWTLLGMTTDQPNLVIQNIILSLLNLFGMWRWLGWQARIEKGGEEAERKSRAVAGDTLFPAKLFAGGNIAGRDGKTLGKAVEAMVGFPSGRIFYVVAGEGGVAGVGERLRRIDWGEVSVGEDVLIVGGSSLDSFPELEAEHWPAR